MYVKGDMTGVGELSGQKTLMALVMGKGLRIISEVSGCSEKFRNSMQMRCRRKVPHFFPPSKLSWISCHIATEAWDICSTPGSGH